MYTKKPDVDIIRDMLELTLVAYPDSVFVKSLAFQYEERGGLSKKQLEGLYKKAGKVKTMPGSTLATLEAVILKRPTRYKSALPENTPLYTKDATAGKLIDAILQNTRSIKECCSSRRSSITTRLSSPNQPNWKGFPKFFLSR